MIGPRYRRVIVQIEGDFYPRGWLPARYLEEGWRASSDGLWRTLVEIRPMTMAERKQEIGRRWFMKRFERAWIRNGELIPTPEWLSHNA